MKTRRILGIATVVLGLGIAALASATESFAQKGKGASIGNFGNAGLVKGGGSVRDRRGQEPKTVPSPPPKVVPKRCILTPTDGRPYDPYKSPGKGKRPQIQDHRS